MSSAAKLRTRGIAIAGATAIVMTSFGPAAFASWDDAPQTATVDAVQTTGTIGVVDSDPADAENQGATLVEPGKTGQAIGDVRITLPNRFRAGDIVDLVLMDRSAAEATNGFTNSGPSTSLGFSGEPTVAVSAVQNDDTIVDADTDAGGTTTPNPNIGETVNNPWIAPGAVDPTDPTTVKPTVAPTFSTAIQQDTGLQGKNRIRLTVTSDPSTGDPNAVWAVTLSGLKVDLGANVTPGELRVVPFAANRDPESQAYTESTWFQANEKNDDTAGADRAVNTYTVPAYVSPVTVSSELQNITADGQPQAVGTLTVAETTAYSMGNGTYRLNVNNATIENEDASSIQVTTTGGPATQQVSGVTTGTDATTGNDYVEFTLAGADAATLSSIKVDGLLLSTTTPATLEFSVTGGTISGSAASWLAAPGTGTLPAGAPSQIGAAADLGVVNQADIEAPLDELLQSGVAVAPSTRIGGNNRYETATKIAAARLGGQYAKAPAMIIASGESYADALSASYLSQRTGAPILLTMRGMLNEDTRDALRNHQVDRVFVIGGEAAVSSDVATTLRGLNTYQRDAVTGNVTESTDSLQVTRLGGASRYTTNQLVNMYAAAWGTNATPNTIGKTVYRYGEAAKNTAIVARGDVFPDALAAGVLTEGMRSNGVTRGADAALPLILTEPNRLSEAAEAQVDRLDVQHALLIGDSGALSDTVKTDLEDKGLTDTRIGGADRYATAAAVNEFAMRDSDVRAANTYPGLGFLEYVNGEVAADNTVNTYLANGLKYPDALTAAPWIGDLGDTLSLVLPNEIPGGTRDFLTKRSSDVARAIALGLGDVVSFKVLNDANAIVSAK